MLSYLKAENLKLEKESGYLFIFFYSGFDIKMK